MVTAFKKVDGVTDATVDFKKKTATVTYDPAKTSEEKVLGALKDTKFSASKPEEAKDAKKGS